VNIAQITAWRQRRLVFEWETLAAIAAEFNRYNRTPRIRVEGDAVGARRYTAVFDADHPQTLLKFLSRDPDLTFATEGDDFVIRGRQVN
jgi:transmembrane sensor